MLFLFCAIATHLFSLHNLGVSAILIAAPVLIAPSLLPAACWHQKGNIDKREAALTLPWVLLLMTMIPCVVVVSARLGMPLRDQAFLHMDEHLGFNIPAIMAWAARHPIAQHALSRSYTLLFWMIGLAALLPALMGKRKASQEFLLANAIVFLLSVPLFTAFPAVGPWVAYHFPANAAQRLCELSIRGMHVNSSSGAVEAFGVVCFPSFHVIWAILSAVALQSIKWLRVPAIVLAGLIIASTLTTGWHYGTDVIGGFFMCALSLASAKAILRLQSIKDAEAFASAR
ncbi:phosphatase PAP2 family protein [Alloacidobacterium dinghuense]|uniref:Phosphatase PAP2 family protein n=1 Tax=Alloacidobacterium dinghuense TaxID=2763107 RepID=A0A7G8BG59_9BACT|nr:phosphatase PAP2 family protein [Alloacidobacterium dinghuense]QNI31529.1 phosphatase PAP2 family protein [Alloacidobacterium dinghuense]